MQKKRKTAKASCGHLLQLNTHRALPVYPVSKAQNHGKRWKTSYKKRQDQYNPNSLNLKNHGHRNIAPISLQLRSYKKHHRLTSSELLSNYRLALALGWAE